MVVFEYITWHDYFSFFLKIKKIRSHLSGWHQNLSGLNQYQVHSGFWVLAFACKKLASAASVSNDDDTDGPAPESAATT